MPTVKLYLIDKINCLREGPHDTTKLLHKKGEETSLL